VSYYIIKEEQLIRAENITKGYGGHILFDTASFSVNKGERVGLVGRNGHG
jgi:ATP-binding cassette subfamily F protein 3